MVLKTAASRWQWWGVFLACLIPLVWLVFNIIFANLGADPAKEIVKTLGVWSINMLWLSLFVSPLRRAGVKWIGKYRRMLGLYAFFYVTLHLLAFATFLLGWRLDLLATELVKRPYIIVGFLAWLLLIPLAITSTKAMQRSLGRLWGRLHKSVYLIGVLGLVHLVWLIRASYIDAVIYGSLLLLAFAERLYRKQQRKVKKV